MVEINNASRRKLQEELLRFERYETIGCFVQQFADDFSNLLAAIWGNIALAKRHLDPDNQACSLLHQAEEASARAKEIIQQLLALAHCREPVRGPLEVSKLLSETALHSQRRRDIGYRYAIEPDSDLVRADRMQMKEVFHNLLVFARELLPDGGIIEFGTERLLVEAGHPIFSEGAYTRITIEVQGAVLSDVECARVLEPAFLTRWRECRADCGPGIGLAGAYQVVRKHGGLLEVLSPGAGVRINVYLPAVASS